MSTFKLAELEIAELFKAKKLLFDKLVTISPGVDPDEIERRISLMSWAERMTTYADCCVAEALIRARGVQSTP